MKHRFSKFLPFLTFLGDVVVLNALILTLYLKGHFIIHTYDRSWFSFLIVLNLAWLLIVLFTNPYRISRVYPVAKVAGSTLYSTFQHFLISSTLIYLFEFTLVHKWSPIALYIAFAGIILTWRLIFYYSLSIYRTKGFNSRNVVILGYGAIAKHLEVFFTLHPEYGYHFGGYFDDNIQHHKVLGSTADLKMKLLEPSHNIDEIYCCLPYVKYGQIKQLIDICEDQFIKVKLITDFRAFSSKGLTLERYDHIPVLNVSSIPLDNRNNQILKRGFDIAFSVTVIVLLLSWLFPLIAIAIKLTSKGPVLFKQKRTGKDNENFYCWKFRTMYINQLSDVRQATKGDNRITPLGAFLRKTSLDELPQFFNVLQGYMSVVGPRPHMLKHTEEYSRLIKKFMMRHHVKPGITGLAQSKGYRGETKNLIEMKNRVTLDRFYVENWSFLLDIKIIVATVISLTKRDQKAY